MNDLPRFAAGETDAVRAFYRRYGGLVFSVAFAVLGDLDLAADATQRAFLDAWRATGAGDEGRSLPASLATIATRAALDVGATAQGPTAPPPTTERITAVAEVRRALAELSTRERELIRMEHAERLTPDEIARRLQIPVAEVGSLGLEAHRRLARVLRSAGGAIGT